MAEPLRPEEEEMEGETLVLTEDELAMEAERQRQEERVREAERIARLDNLGNSLSVKRSDAITARQISGIEEEWLEDEEFYQGIDDANRAENKAWRTKPPGQTPVTASTTRSTVFPNITRPYVDAASARIADMLLPTDDRSWSLGPTPVPDMADLAKGKVPPSMVRSVAQQYPGEPEQAKVALQSAVQQAMETVSIAREKAEKAQKRIEDWHVECQWHAEVRKAIEDCARIGTAVLKGPIPVKKRCVAFIGGRLVIKEEIKPATKRIDPWNFFPDGACGENIHNGAYCFERDHVTAKQLRDLKGGPGYIDSQIDACIKEGPQMAVAEPKKTPDQGQINDKTRFEIWYFHGYIEREDMEAAGCDCSEIEGDVAIPAMVEMVNHRVIKVALNPLDSGDLPYDVMPWQRRSGMPWGSGVARHIRTPQRIVTAATRNLMDNAGIAAGPMLVFRQGVVQPADGVAELKPRKMWFIAEDAVEMADATKAIGVIKVDMLVPELMEIIQLGLKLAEDVTGLPMLLQGQQGKAPDTVGGMQMLNNNASAVLRRLARLFDDCITEPHVRRYYTWLLQYGEDDEKGDYSIDARGSSALVERDLQNQTIAQMGQLVLDPRFGKDPKKWMDEFLKSTRLDPKKFNFDDEKWQQIVENMAQGPQDPRIAVAELRAQTEERLQQLDQAFQERENARDRALEMVKSEMDNQLGSAGITEETRRALEAIKGRLGETVLKLNTQRALSRESRVAKQVATPPSEPKGKAEPGMAFQA